MSKSATAGRSTEVLSRKHCPGGSLGAETIGERSRKSARGPDRNAHRPSVLAVVRQATREVASTVERGPMRRILTGTVVCLLLAGGSATGARAAGRLPAFCDGSWRSPKPVPHSSGYRLNDVVAVGQKDVWIVGAAEDGPLALHWNGYTWRRTPVRGVRLHAKLEGVAAGPSREVRAV